MPQGAPPVPLRLVTSALLLALLAGCASTTARETGGDLPYFLKVDSHLYRGGQPTPQGLRRLAALGIKTVINLRAESGLVQRQRQRLVESLGMRWVYLPMHAYWRPSEAQIMTFLKTVTDSEQQPVFLHCRRGEDRTGTLVAVYRVVVQGWEPQRAYDEARALGLGGNPLMRRIILYDAKSKYAQAVVPKR